jgi:hypothetical protein
MRDFLKSTGRWLSAGWYWPLVLLALPVCALQTGGIPNPNAFDPGSGPLTGAVMCDIPKVPDEVSGNCANSTDEGSGMSTLHAAVALAAGESTSFALDFSPAALSRCKPLPGKIDFFGPYPDGTAVCLNCAQQIPSKYANPTAVCVAKCKELVTVGGSQPPEGIDEFCRANARVSTNFAPNICFNDACSSGGTLLPGFVDPRRTAEPVKWTDLIGTSALFGNSLERTAPTTGPALTDFNAGAASEQLITKGDAWVEFAAGENNLSHVLGVRESCADITLCPDTDPSLNDIGFSILLNLDGQVYTIESSPSVTMSGALGPYDANERFRVHIVDNNDGTATISYSRVVGSCTPGSFCNETQLSQHVGPGPKYPLRIDASLREQTAILANVTVMRIQTQ